jgi:hypothetical protein
MKHIWRLLAASQSTDSLTKRLSPRKCLGNFARDTVSFWHLLKHIVEMCFVQYH